MEIIQVESKFQIFERELAQLKEQALCLLRDISPQAYTELIQENKFSEFTGQENVSN